MRTLLDPLFFVPFVNGLVLAALLPVLGSYSRLRGEWLASLGIAQAAAAGIVLATLFTSSLAVGAALGVVLAAAAKAMLGRTGGNDIYVVMLLAGWSAALLMAANTTGGNDLARGLLEGQIYFTTRTHLGGLAILAVVGASVLWSLSDSILLGRFFPEHFSANGNDNPPHNLAFDLLTAVALAAACSVIGVMAAFAMVFVPPWVAFLVATGWRNTLIWSGALGVGAYVGSFVLAIVLDQPYGPVLVATLLIVALGRTSARRSV
jgi:zinc/manganese transport system permease protein